MSEKLDSLALKSAKSKKAADEGAKLFCEEFLKQRDCSFAAEYLGKFHYCVCLDFFKNAGLSEREAEEIAALWEFRSKAKFSAEWAFLRGLLEGGFNTKTALDFAGKLLEYGRGKNGFYAVLISDYKKVIDSAGLHNKFAKLGEMPGGEVIAEFISAAGETQNNLEAGELRRELSEARAQIADLNARLEQAFKMDENNKTSELLTLKTNVSEALKEEYREFQNSDRSFSEDNFAANTASLFRIFKILKRFGFSLE